MEQRPISKLAVMSLILSFTSLSFIALLVTELYDIDCLRFLSPYIIIPAFSIISIIALIISLRAMKSVTQTAIRGKSLAVVGLTLSISSVILYSWAWIIQALGSFNYYMEHNSIMQYSLNFFLLSLIGALTSFFAGNRELRDRIILAVTVILTIVFILTPQYL